MPPRAPALPRDERRAAIASAALGILRDRGQSATTREIAQAAGVAEGTLFRAFDSKDELVSVALRLAFDPGPLMCAVERIDAGLPLRDRLVEAVGLLQDRYVEVLGLMQAMGLLHPPERSGWPGAVLDALEALVEPDAAQLRVSPQETVRLLGLLAFAGTHHVLTQGDTLTPETIVDVVLDGVRKAD